MKIDLPLFHIPSRAHARVVKAEIVDVAPHLPLTWAVHRRPKGWWPCEGMWQISDLETGSHAADFYESRKEAIQKATVYLSKKTPAAIAKALRKMLKLYPECGR